MGRSLQEPAVGRGTQKEQVLEPLFPEKGERLGLPDGDALLFAVAIENRPLFFVVQVKSRCTECDLRKPAAQGKWCSPGTEVWTCCIAHMEPCLAFLGCELRIVCGLTKRVAGERRECVCEGDTFARRRTLAEMSRTVRRAEVDGAVYARCRGGMGMLNESVSSVCAC